LRIKLGALKKGFAC